MKVAAYQAPLLPAGSIDAPALIRNQVHRCEAEGVTLLCCPEAILGGLADNAEHPTEFAIPAGRLDAALQPLASDTVTTIIGFTEQACENLHALPLVGGTRDNEVVYVPKAFAEQDRFQLAIARTAQRLAPHVVSITPTLGDDWSGEPAVFLMVILTDAASQRDQLLNVSNQVSQAIVQQVQPLEQWGVLPYFNFRSQSEQAKLNQPALA
jgi:hypothetical protein